MANSGYQINVSKMAHMLDHDNHETRKGLKEVLTLNRITHKRSFAEHEAAVCSGSLFPNFYSSSKIHFSGRGIV